MKSVIPPKDFTTFESDPQPDSVKSAFDPVASAPAGDALMKRKPMIEQSPAAPKASPEAQYSQQEAGHAHENQIPVDIVQSQPLRIHPEQKAVDPVRPSSPTPSTAPTLVESPKNDSHPDLHIKVPTSPINKYHIDHVVLHIPLNYCFE